MAVARFGTQTWGADPPDFGFQVAGPVPGTFPLTAQTPSTPDLNTILVDNDLETELGQSTTDLLHSGGVSATNPGVPTNATVNRVSLIYGPGFTPSRLETGHELRAATVLMVNGSPSATWRDHGAFIEGPFPSDAGLGGVVVMPEFTVNLNTNSLGEPWTVDRAFAEIYCHTFQGHFDHGTFFWSSENRLEIDFDQVAPTGLTTASATNVTHDRCIMNASLDPGGATVLYPITVGFIYGLTPNNLNLANVNTVPATGTGTQIFGSQSPRLLQNTTYFYRAFVTWDGHTLFAPNVESFTTQALNLIGRIF